MSYFKNWGFPKTGRTI